MSTIHRTLFFVLIITGSLLTPVLAHALLLEPEVIFDNNNIYVVQNSPKKQTQFTISSSYTISYIRTYHWNYQKGKTPGTIGLKHSDGTTYGPWQAYGKTGQWEVPNASWIVEPMVEIKPGTYTIIDSDPATWANNAQSDYRGMALVKGLPLYNDPRDTVTLGSIGAELTRLTFFEETDEGRNEKDMVFSTLFEQQSTRYVGYMMYMNHFAPDEDVQIPLTIQYVNPDGSLFGEFEHLHKIQSDWTTSNSWWAYGWSEAGNWQPGTYTVRILDGSILVGKNSFTICTDQEAADLLFNWLEPIFPTLFPTEQSTEAYPEYNIFYRYYPTAKTMLATWRGNLYFLDDQPNLYDLGEVNLRLSAVESLDN